MTDYPKGSVVTLPMPTQLAPPKARQAIRERIEVVMREPEVNWKERADTLAARVAELEAALKDMLECHDGYHEHGCDGLDGAWSDSDYEHPSHRPHERDCDCVDVGRRLAAKAVLERRAVETMSEFRKNHVVMYRSGGGSGP